MLSFDGNIVEFIIVDESVSTVSQAAVEAYLAYKWGLGANLPSSHPFKNDSSLFSLDANGTLTANQIFDYEADDRNYSITVFATDDHNATLDKNFTISVTNVVEDLDGDGTEDHYDDDIDGDGLSNAEELANNSDPRDASSSNRPPSDINTTSNLTIAENSVIGSVIGEFNATDLDGDTNITFSLLNGSWSEMGWSSSRLFGDNDSGVSSDLNYTCAVNVNGSNKVVNGVTFIGSSGTSGDGWPPAQTSGFSQQLESRASSVLETHRSEFCQMDFVTMGILKKSNDNSHSWSEFIFILQKRINAWDKSNVSTRHSSF